MLTPFSWPSMVPCWMAVNTSLQFMEVGSAPRARKKPMYTTLPGDADLQVRHILGAVDLVLGVGDLPEAVVEGAQVRHVLHGQALGVVLSAGWCR